MRSSVAAFVFLALIGFSSAARLCNIRSCAKDVDDEQSAASLRTLSPSIKTYNVIPGSYRINGENVELFPEGKEFPVTLQTTESAQGHLEVTLKVVNTIMYEISYNIKDGWVSKITPGFSTLMSGTDHQMTVESRLSSVIAATQQLGFEKDGLLGFINDKTGTRVAFTPAVRQFGYLDQIPWIYPGLTGVRRYTVVDGSYQVNGQRLPLFSSYKFPVTVETSEVMAGRLDVNLKIVNTISYQIYYNVADGWVSNIVPGYSTFLQGPYEQIDVENKLKAIISTTQQLGFDRDGQLQFISNNSATRVAFKPQQYREPEAAPYRHVQSFAHGKGTVPKYYDVLSGSYQVNGQAQQLFPYGQVFPLRLQTTEVYPGRLDVVLRAFNTIKYQINFNVADGWVSSIYFGPSTVNQGTLNVMDVEYKLNAIIGYAQQVAFNDDGVLQFIKDNAATRIAFKPTNRRLEGREAITLASAGKSSDRPIVFPDSWNSWNDAGQADAATPSGWNDGSVKQYNVVASSYQVNGKKLQLFKRQPVFVNLETTDAGRGVLDVTLSVVNAIRWQIHFNPVDGWVSSIYGGLSTMMTGAPESLDVESKLRSIIGSVQQIAFERDGLIQFIKDQSATRIAFTPI